MTGAARATIAAERGGDRAFTISCGASSAALGIITANAEPHSAFEEAFHAAKKGVRLPAGASGPVRRLRSRGDEPPRRSSIARRRFASAGVSAGALFEMLKPNYAWAIEVPPDDSRIVAKRVDVPSPQGNGSIKGYLVRPANTEKLPAVLVVHENRGLNPYIEDVARRLAIANFIAFAPDGLTSVGGYPGDDEKGAALFKEVDPAKMQADFLAAAEWLKSLARFDGQARRGRLLLRRRGREQTRGQHGLAPRRRGSLLRASAERRRRGQDQGADQRAIWRARQTHHRRLAGVRRRTRARPAFRTRGTSTRAPTTASTTTRRPATTKRRRRRRGEGRSTGSTNICGPEGRATAGRWRSRALRRVGRPCGPGKGRQADRACDPLDSHLENGIKRP